jgi:preprotein translocase subunit SecE
MATGKNDKKTGMPAERNEAKALDKKKSDTAPVKKTAPKKAQDEGPGLPTKIRQFFREVRIELRKVTWPTRKETLASTSVVLILVVIVSVYLGLVDSLLAGALKMLFK